MSDIHVVPTNDIKEHVLHDWCSCKPELRKNVYVHNSFGKRELIEQQLSDIGLSAGGWDVVKEQ